jgi:hypothetical protein
MKSLRTIKIQPKLLLFYGGTLAFVVALFQVVTRYGETQLIASPNINGRYLSTQAMPGCPESSRVMLSILQSGIYLNGAVEVVEEADAKEAKSKGTQLSGAWGNQQVTLAGDAALCQAAGKMETVAIAGTVSGVAENAVFSGTISGIGQPWQFTGQRLVEAKKAKE